MSKIMQNYILLDQQKGHDLLAQQQREQDYYSMENVEKTLQADPGFAEWLDNLDDERVF